MITRVGEAEQGQEDALYDGVNLHVNLATKEDVIRHYRIQLAKLEVRASLPKADVASDRLGTNILRGNTSTGRQSEAG
jgi:hypothetical protein